MAIKDNQYGAATAGGPTDGYFRMERQSANERVLLICTEDSRAL